MIRARCLEGEQELEQERGIGRTIIARTMMISMGNRRRPWSGAAEQQLQVDVSFHAALAPGSSPAGNAASSGGSGIGPSPSR